MIRRASWIAALMTTAACACAPTAAPPAPRAAARAAPPQPKPPPTAQEANMPSSVVSTPEAALERLFTAKTVSADWFTPEFIDKVPVARIETLLKQVTADAGPFQAVRAKGGAAYEVAFQRASIIATVHLDASGRFAGLFVRPGGSAAGSIEDALTALRALPGKVSLLVSTDGADKAAIDPDKPLAVGSTFKLAVLAALRDDVRGKKRSFRDVVELEPRWKSLPSGMLHDWPAKAPVTLDTLATLMISISDNTATDALLDLVGRAAVEKHAPRNQPFLSTADMFRLKGPGGRALLERWRQSDAAARRKLLPELAALPLPPTHEYPLEPTALDVEWFFTTRELCALMAKVKDPPMVRVNPGPAGRSDWDAVAYKGGSEPGIINMTTWLEKKGRSHCVSASWNAETKLDDTKFALAYGGLLASLARAP